MINQKGNVFSILYVGVLLLVSVLCGVFCLKIVQSFSDEFYASATSVGQDIIDAGGEAYAFMDYAYLLFTGLLFVSFLVSAFFVRSNPAFFAVNVVVLLLLVSVGGIFEDVAGSFSNSSALVNVTSTFSRSFLVLENTGLLFSVFGVGFLVIMYAGWSNVGGGGL